MSAQENRLVLTGGAGRASSHSFCRTALRPVAVRLPWRRGHGDSLEDTDATPEELARHFGDEVAGIVCAVSEPPGAGTYAERKARLRAEVADASDEATAVYAADKVAKARELRMSLARDWSIAAGARTADKLGHYWASLALLEQRLEGDPLVRQLRFELEALELLPPRTPAELARPDPSVLARHGRGRAADRGRRGLDHVGDGVWPGDHDHV